MRPIPAARAASTEAGQAERGRAGERTRKSEREREKKEKGGALFSPAAAPPRPSACGSRARGGRMLRPSVCRAPGRAARFHARKGSETGREREEGGLLGGRGVASLSSPSPTQLLCGSPPRPSSPRRRGPPARRSGRNPRPLASPGAAAGPRAAPPSRAARKRPVSFFVSSCRRLRSHPPPPTNLAPSYQNKKNSIGKAAAAAPRRPRSCSSSP